ncbi:hypothetical protein Purlil1_12709 [Purpureocillium lilacinum]|uniref:Uncharacterized protein n=1 Tax=Purpureocillium lilacinum TaxID=33203 RepID=A0ABR0BG39_PURLI|nr:hypothetical protein Purlil1_12709 [Purpureocillium lilacinum]
MSTVVKWRGPGARRANRVRSFMRSFPASAQVLGPGRGRRSRHIVVSYGYLRVLLLLLVALLGLFVASLLLGTVAIAARVITLAVRDIALAVHSIALVVRNVAIDTRGIALAARGITLGPPLRPAFQMKSNSPKSFIRAR